MSLSPHPRNGLPEDTVRGWGDKWLRPLDGSQITPARIVVGVIAGLLVLGALIAANVVTTDYGFIPVGFGFEATAGTLFAGVMLASRDAVQDALGRWAVVVMILLGTIVSFLVSDPQIAIAAALAFGFAELADFAVYTPIRNRSIIGDKRWALAVVASNVVGALADSVIFLGIAFGLGAITPALPGQMVGKLWATLAYLLLGWVVAKTILNPLRKAGRLGQPREEPVKAT
ncbi:MAG TPA: VUT family protein [Brevibacterium sp.]|nr:VUT family protein [Brevibacterium sp.]